MAPAGEQAGHDLRAAARSGGVVLQAGRDIITGNVFTGGFARLRDVWLDPEPVFEDVRVDRFTGREWLVERIDRFVRRHDRGYVVIEAPAGVGKTAVAAWLAARRGWPCHFTRRRKGRLAATALRNLAAQIIAGYRLSDQFTPGGMLPETAGEPGWFEQVLKAAGGVAMAAGQKLVLVVDGLDEAETFDGDLPLGLPSRPPRGVIIVVTCRSSRNLFSMGWPWEHARFELTDRRNLADMQLFLHRTVAGDARLAEHVGAAGMTEDAFVDLLLARCGGVWVYLRYVLDALHRDQCSPLDLAALPSNLAGYYTQELRPFEPGEDQWVRLRVLITLAAVTEPLPARVLADLAGLPDAEQVEGLCADTLRPFLTHTVGADDIDRYAIYHLSLRDYLHGVDAEPELDRGRAHRLRVLCREAHGRIADHYLESFGGLAHGLPRLARDSSAAQTHYGYPLRNLAHHLERAARADDLDRLLGIEDNVWYTAHDRAGTLSDYLTDIRRAQRLAAGQVDRDLAEGRPSAAFARELHYTMIASAIVSLTANVPSALIVRLVEHGLWTLDRALAHADRLRPSADRAVLLVHLASCCTGQTRQGVLAKAIALARAQAAPYPWAWALTEVVTTHPDPVPDGLVHDTLAAVAAVDDDDFQAWAVAELVPRADQAELLRIVIGIDDDAARRIAAQRLVSHADPGQRLAILDAVARVMEDDWQRAALISATVPLLDESAGAAGAVLGLAADISTVAVRAWALTTVVPLLPPDETVAVVADALAAARAAESADDQAWALAMVAAAVPERRALVAEATRIASTVDDPVDRAWCLTPLAPLLSAEERDDTVALLLSAADGTDDGDLATIVRLLADTGVDLDRLLAVVRSIGDEPSRASALAAVAESCDEGQLPDVLAELGSLTDAEEPLLVLASRAAESYGEMLLDETGRLPTSYSRFRVVSEMVPHLAPALLGRALATLQSISNEFGEALLLDRLSRRCAPELLTEAVTTARRITHLNDRVWVLSRIARSAPDGLRTMLHREMLAMTRTIPEPGRRFSALDQFVDQLDGDLRQEAVAELLAAARSPDLVGPRPYALSEAARLLPDQAAELNDEAIAAAYAVPDKVLGAAFLAQLAARQPEPARLLRAAVDLARLADSRLSRAARTALRVMEFVPDAILVRCLGAVHDFFAGDQVPDFFGELVRLLPNTLLEDAIDAAVTLMSGYALARVLGVAVPYLPAGPRASALRHLMSDTSDIAGRRAVLTQATAAWQGRIGVAELDLVRRCLDGVYLENCFDLLAFSEDLLPLIGGADIFDACLASLCTTQRWWP